MKEAYFAKKRNAHNRKRKRIFLLSVEGNNRTEKKYISGLRFHDVQIHFATGNDTDPVNMTKSLLRDYKKKGLTQELGDLAFCIVDGDLSKEKESQILKADEMIKAIPGRVIVSNPCVEVWFLCHFTDSTRQYVSGDEAIKRLQAFIPGYEKNMKGLANILEDKTNTALDNAKKLDDYNQNAGRKIHKADYQPGTEMPILIALLLEKETDTADSIGTL
ncbi:MAG: RloB domain-containing protein [Lachnospiraceae bacterium]|nr:RloB domain-containing protein [Lachnospiraceae bacterium]